MQKKTELLPTSIPTSLLLTNIGVGTFCHGVPANSKANTHTHTHLGGSFFCPNACWPSQITLWKCPFWGVPSAFSTRGHGDACWNCAILLLLKWQRLLPASAIGKAHFAESGHPLVPKVGVPWARTRLCVTQLTRISTKSFFKAVCFGCNRHDLYPTPEAALWGDQRQLK